MFSTRSFGQPEFYVLDSRYGELHYIENNWCSIGKGKDILDNLLEQEYFPRIKNLDEHLDKKVIPYILCLWLSELVLSSDRQRFEKEEVGGAFHFIYQTKDYEASQKPALYVLNDINTKENVIFSWLYRVCYVQGCLSVEEFTPPNQYAESPFGKLNKIALCNEASRPEIMDLKLKDLELAIREEANSLPWYYFCGFGFVNRIYRKGSKIHLADQGKHKYVIGKDGQIASEYKEFLVRCFEAK